MTEMIAGVEIPDSPLARAVTELVRESAPPLLFHHSRRVYLFGMLQGRRRHLVPDPELVYVGAMCHDLGLTDRFRTRDRRFEVDGAEAARELLVEYGAAPDAVRRVWTSIALHTTPGVPEFMEPEIALVTAGVETDVLGIGRAELSAEDLDAVTAAHPRPDFKRQILAAFDHGFRDRPATTFGTVNADVLARFEPGFTRTDFVDVIEGSDWPE